MKTGEELLATQLVEGTIVVLVGTHRPDQPMTAWVDEVTARAVAFYAGTLGIALVLRVDDNGHMFDAQNHRIAAYRYLVREPEAGTTRLMVRGFKAGKLLWENQLVLIDAEIERIIPTLAEEHSAACASGELGMIEIEFLDVADPRDRFFRIGVETDGMVNPIRVRMGKEPTQ